MKDLKSLWVLFAFTVLITACGDDDDDDSSSDFINQNVQGMINGIDWEGNSGLAEPSVFEEGMVSIEITAESVTDVCEEFFLEGLRVFFDVPNEVGTYSLDLGTQTLTLFDPEESLNVIVIDGMIEIQSIDATDGGTVTGRIVGESGSDNFINGNFSVTYCPE